MKKSKNFFYAVRPLIWGILLKFLKNIIYYRFKCYSLLTILFVMDQILFVIDTITHYK